MRQTLNAKENFPDISIQIPLQKEKDTENIISWFQFFCSHFLFLFSNHQLIITKPELINKQCRHQQHMKITFATIIRYY